MSAKSSHQRETVRVFTIHRRARASQLYSRNENGRYNSGRSRGNQAATACAHVQARAKSLGQYEWGRRDGSDGCVKWREGYAGNARKIDWSYWEIGRMRVYVWIGFVRRRSFYIEAILIPFFLLIHDDQFVLIIVIKGKTPEYTLCVYTYMREIFHGSRNVISEIT